MWGGLNDYVTQWSRRFKKKGALVQRDVPSFSIVSAHIMTACPLCLLEYVLNEYT